MPGSDGSPAATRPPLTRSTRSSRSSTASVCSRCGTSCARSAWPTRSRPTLVALVRATRTHPDLELGASPRASVAVYRAAQAAAVLAGRSFVTPDDVKAVAPAVLAHRLVVDLDRSLHGATAAAALDQILATTPVAAAPRGLTRGGAGPARRIVLITIGSLLAVPIAILLGRDDPAARGRARGLGPQRARRGPLPPAPRRPARRRSATSSRWRSRSGTDAGCRSPGCAPTTTRAPGSRCASVTSITDEAEARGPAQRVDAPSVRAGRSPLPRRGGPARRPLPRPRRAVDRRPLRPSSGHRGAPRHRHLPRLAAHDPRRPSSRPTDRWGDLERARGGPRRGSGPVRGHPPLRARGPAAARSTRGPAPASASR